MAELITAPIRLAAAIPSTVTDTVFNVFEGSCGSPGGTADTNLYETASPRMDLSNLIYFYTELRSSTKELVVKLCEDKDMSYKTRAVPSDVHLLYNAITSVEAKLEEINTSTNPVCAVKEYKESIQNLENLRMKFRLTAGDVEVFKQYFQILSNKAKYNTDIKRDLRLYSDYINPAFRIAFGGTEFNIKTVEDLVARDESSYIQYIDDAFTKTSLDAKGFINGFDSEIVYAIAVSDKFRTVTVVFRGSVNANDWITNIQVNSTECKFPGFTTDRGMNTVERKSFGRVHEGFYKYLFGKTEEGPDGSTKSKGEEIMGKLTALLNGPKKGYTVVTTGHSLGGALSTLMAARCAAFQEFDSTVLNVSYASPFVGDQAFRDSFYEWEMSNRLKHLRVSNYEDIVPLIPFSTLPGGDYHTYKHTGMNVKLYNKSLIHPFHIRLSYPKKGSFINEIRNALNSNIFVGVNINIMNHFGSEYSKRLKNAKEDLETLNLDRLYSDPNITGWVYNEPMETEGTEEETEIPEEETAPINCPIRLPIEEANPEETVVE